MRLLLRAGLGAGIGLVALVCAASSVADRGRISFASTMPLTLTAGAEAAVHVCATGPGDVPVRFLVEGFPEAAVSLPQAPAVVPAATCTTLRVTAAAAAAPGTGTLVAVSPGTVSRRPLTIVRSPAKGTAPATELRGVTLEARRHFLYGPPTHLLTGTIPFGPYPGGTRMDVAAIDAPSGTLAVLEHRGDQAYLVIDGTVPPADDHGIVELPVRLEDAGGSGTYRGAFTFTDVTGAPQTVAVTVEVGDSIWWCLLAIVLGILATLLALLLAQRVWPGLRLRRSRRRLAARYRAALRAYNSAVAREDALPRLAFDESSAEAYTSALRQARRRPGGAAATRELVEQADDDRDFLRDDRGLIAVLRELRSAAWRYERSRRPGDGTPEARLLRHARRLLEPRALEVGGATALGAEAATFAALIDRWPKLYERLVVLEEWAADLQAHVATLPAWYQAKLGRARASLTRARAVLLESETPARFGDRALLRYLDRATTTLYEVSAESHSPAFPEPLERQRAVVASEEVRGAGIAVPLAARATWLALPGRELADRARGTIEAATAAPTPAAPAAGRLLAVMLAAGGALATGMTEVYSPTFGSFGSYVTAAGLGVGATAASTALVQAIANLRRASYARIATADSGR